MAVYGWPACRPLDYRTFFALELHLDRQKQRRAVEHWIGALLARGALMDHATADAIAEDSSQADLIRFEHNASVRHGR